MHSIPSHKHYEYPNGNLRLLLKVKKVFLTSTYLKKGLELDKRMCILLSSHVQKKIINVIIAGLFEHFFEPVCVAKWKFCTFYSQPRSIYPRYNLLFNQVIHLNRAIQTRISLNFCTYYSKRLFQIDFMHRVLYIAQKKRLQKQTRKIFGNIEYK